MGNISLAKLKKTIERLKNDLGRKPLPEEIATELGIPVLPLYFIGVNIDWSNY